MGQVIECPKCGEAVVIRTQVVKPEQVRGANAARWKKTRGSEKGEKGEKGEVAVDPVVEAMRGQPEWVACDRTTIQGACGLPGKMNAKACGYRRAQGPCGCACHG